MTSYRLDCSLDSNIPDSDNGGTICLWNGTNIHFKDEWKASITVEGNSGEEAKKLAYSSINMDIFWLQLVIPVTSSSKVYMRVANKGDTLTDLDQQKPQITSNTLTVTVTPKIGLSEGFTLQKFDKGKEHKIFAPTSLRSKIDEIRIPMYYYNRALEENEALYAFINLMICLESMLSDNQELTEKLARRVAVLVSSDYKNKQETYEKMKGFYKIRSEIFHGGEVPSITWDTLKGLLDCTKLSMRNYVLLLEKYQNKKRIKEALDKFFDSDILVEIENVTSNALGTT